jgi:hypothetical protein
VANAERSGHGRLPLELVVLGAACLACCLPLLAGIVATASAALAGLGAILLGPGPWLAAGIAIVVSALAVSVWLLMRRRARRCSTCGETTCAC